MARAKAAVAPQQRNWYWILSVGLAKSHLIVKACRISVSGEVQIG